MLFRHRNRHQDSLASLKEQIHPIKRDHTPSLDHQTQTWLKESAALFGPRAIGSPRHVPHAAQTSRSHEADAPKRTPTSRKTGFATIRTDSTDTHAAFESDAFAVLMPTTRVPILDQPAPNTNTATRAARAEAYKTYQTKAREMRERNDSQGVQVPSELVTYGSNATRAAQCASMQVEISPPASPTMPAGSFPASPPLPQTGWSSPDRTRGQGASHRGERSNICSPRKAVVPNKAGSQTSPTYRVYRNVLDDGISREQTPSPPSIKIRFKPKHTPPVTRTASAQKIPQLAREHDHGTAFRAPSPSKSMPNFTRHNSVEGDSIFGYATRDITGTSVGTTNSAPPKTLNHATETEQGNAKQLSKTNPHKRTFASKWPWFRSTSPRAPAAEPKATEKKDTTNQRLRSTYIDPFTIYAPPTTTPQCLRSASSSPTHSPTKLARNPLHVPKPGSSPVKSKSHPSTAPQTSTFDTGFAQLMSLLSILVKCGIVLYAVVAAWYIVDAVRDAVNTVCAPFRAVRWVGGWVGVVLIWIVRIGGVLWERWGVRVAVRGGWMWKVKWV